MNGTDADVVIIGAGPAGLSAALNLARARRRVVLLDSNRPRNSVTLVAHGFLTRDGITPHALRKLGLAELAAYPEVHHHLGHVEAVTRVDGGFEIRTSRVNASPARTVTAPVVLIASGLRERLPVLPSMASYYGIGLFSCVECDGYEQSDKPLALIGETDDLVHRALLIRQWSSDLTVFTNGIGIVTESEEALLAERGVRVERRGIIDILGTDGIVASLLLEDGERVRVEGGFVRPRWDAALDYAAALGIETDDDGFVTTDGAGRTSIHGVYAAGDSTAPGPQQLIVAAGAGARAAATINRDLLGIPRP
ncbi:NAD(P)/FAD-dependent oxidoreductase [Parafrigoribacterium humi]|uniref:NAD(P)/FAD-dependent oxidoreductase n=1 Tax=Parafrigoribacterium humi TaxID=3144664 RepID=UPI0032EEAB3C